MRRERSPEVCPALERSRPLTADNLNDYRLAFYRIIRLPEADDSGDNLVGNADIHEDDMIILVMDYPVEELNKLGVAEWGQPALEYREL